MTLLTTRLGGTDEARRDAINEKWVELIKGGVQVIILSLSRCYLVKTDVWKPTADAPSNSLGSMKGEPASFEPGEQKYSFLYLHGKRDDACKWTFWCTGQIFLNPSAVSSVDRLAPLESVRAALNLM